MALIDCHSTKLAVSALTVIRRVWWHQISHREADPCQLLRNLTAFPRPEESRVAEMVTILSLLLRTLPFDEPVLSLACDWLLQCFQEFQTYPIMLKVIQSVELILARDQTTQHWILAHDVVRAPLHMVNDLVGFPDVTPPKEFYLFVTKCVELVGPDEGIPLLQQIRHESYFLLLTGSPASIAHSCLKMVGLFILWDQEAAHIFSDEQLFMRLSYNFDHERRQREPEIAWMSFCHALICQGRDSVVHLLLDDGTIRKSAIFMDADLERPDLTYVYIHLIFLMIESSEAAHLEEEVAVSLIRVSNIFPAIDALISEEIVATLPVPIGEIHISGLSQRIWEFVESWQSTIARREESYLE